MTQEEEITVAPDQLLTMGYCESCDIDLRSLEDRTTEQDVKGAPIAQVLYDTTTGKLSLTLLDKKHCGTIAISGHRVFSLFLAVYFPSGSCVTVDRRSFIIVCAPALESSSAMGLEPYRKDSSSESLLLWIQSSTYPNQSVPETASGSSRTEKCDPNGTPPMSCHASFEPVSDDSGLNSSSRRFSSSSPEDPVRQDRICSTSSDGNNSGQEGLVGNGKSLPLNCYAFEACSHGTQLRAIAPFSSMVDVCQLTSKNTWPILIHRFQQQDSRRSFVSGDGAAYAAAARIISLLDGCYKKAQPAHEMDENDKLALWTDIKVIFPVCKRQVRQSACVLTLQAPVLVFSDCDGSYGSLSDMLHYLCPFGHWSQLATPMLYLGNYLGAKGDVEVLLTLMALSVVHPGFVHFLRGNEDFCALDDLEEEEECSRAFVSRSIEIFGERRGMEFCKHSESFFRTMPIAAVIDGCIFACHGGVPRIVSANVDFNCPGAAENCDNTVHSSRSSGDLSAEMKTECSHMMRLLVDLCRGFVPRKFVRISSLSDCEDDSDEAADYRRLVRGLLSNYPSDYPQMVWSPGGKGEAFGEDHLQYCLNALGCTTMIRGCCSDDGCGLSARFAGRLICVTSRKSDNGGFTYRPGACFVSKKEATLVMWEEGVDAEYSAVADTMPQATVRDSFLGPFTTDPNFSFPVATVVEVG